MTPDDLETVVARTGHERFRWLTSEANPDVESREGYRRYVREQAAGATPAEYPPLATQAANAIGAVARFVASGCAVVGRDEYDRRRAICEGCEHFDHAEDRCRKCGCNLAVKPWSKAEKCPVGKW
jgi:hypothetical protein